VGNVYVYARVIRLMFSDDRDPNAYAVCVGLRIAMMVEIIGSLIS